MHDKNILNLIYSSPFSIILYLFDSENIVFIYIYIYYLVIVLHIINVYYTSYSACKSYPLMWYTPHWSGSHVSNCHIRIVPIPDFNSYNLLSPDIVSNRSMNYDRNLNYQTNISVVNLLKYRVLLCILYDCIYSIFRDLCFYILLVKYTTTGSFGDTIKCSGLN